ncbi:terminase, large subunit [uncultured Gammaproteobacteria bacterium]
MVVFVGGRQSAKSEPALNAIGWTIDQAPAPIIVFLPSLEEVRKWERIKLQPMIDATPALARLVAAKKSRDEDASTGTFKRFAGGTLTIANAGSSKALQMISGRLLVCEELTEWPDDVGGRGHPFDQAVGRLDAWSERGVKIYCPSTPGLEGGCRISEMYEASDRRRYYVPCPHCGWFQVLGLDRLVIASKRVPYGATMTCRANGCVIEHHAKRGMLAKGVWLKTFPAADEADQAPDLTVSPEDVEQFRARQAHGLQPGFHVNQFYSPFRSWDDIAAKFLDIGDDYDRADNEKKRDFVTQALGEAYAAAGEAPDHERLYALRQPFPLGVVFKDAPYLTGFIDVQGNRFEYAVYGWGPDLGGRLIDYGTLPADTGRWADWAGLKAVLRRRYRGETGSSHRVDVWGIDTGYQTNLAYRFCRAHAGVMACDGRDGWRRAAIGTPSDVDVDDGGRKIRGGCKLWPIGTWPIKQTIYGALRQLLSGPGEDGRFPSGTILFPAALDLSFFKGLTAESLETVSDGGRTVRRWVKKAGQANEPLDTLVGCRALAEWAGVELMTAEQWQAMVAERFTVTSQPFDLFSLASPVQSGPEVTAGPEDDADEPAGFDACAAIVAQLGTETPTPPEAKS